MKNPAFITEDNLIGSIASAMLKLKTFNAKKENLSDLEDFITLIKFISGANNANYRELLYDKNFFVTEIVLKNLHEEMVQENFASKVDLNSLAEMLSANLSNYAPAEVDKTILKLQDVMMFLFQSKSKNQIYL